MRAVSSDAGHEREASCVGVDGGGDGLESEDAEGAEDAEVGGAAAVAPSSGHGVGAVQDGAYMRGDPGGAGGEGGVFADLAGVVAAKMTARCHCLRA